VDEAWAASPDGYPLMVWPAPAVTAVTFSWRVDETAQPVAVKRSSIARVWFGGKTFSWAADVGRQAVAG
jgi:hypothetical protein